jgi:hypothetical protein
VKNIAYSIYFERVTDVLPSAAMKRILAVLLGGFVAVNGTNSHHKYSGCGSEHKRGSAGGNANEKARRMRALDERANYW